jgi:hypothetical protein
MPVPMTANAKAVQVVYPRGSRRSRRIALFLLASLFLSQPCLGKWANIGEPVPLNRLIRNVSRFVARRPNDARGHYTLGRLYSLAFARGIMDVDVIKKDWSTKKPLPLPGFPPYTTILEKSTGERQMPAVHRFLFQSGRHYRRAIQLAPREALYWLGLGWMLEQGISHAGKVDAPFLMKPARLSANQWRDHALAAYRRAYALTREVDLKKERLGPEKDTSISLEAGEGILRLLQGRRLTPVQSAEVARVRETVKALQSKPRAVTPILFPLNGAEPLSALLSRDSAVSFDLAGDGRPEWWPWVSPSAGILVWDPHGTGQITSGRQLFGSVTWWMFWKDGYQPLAALDNNQDGWLSDRELDGLAVWCDRNGNAISEAGEVRPLSQIGIERVAVRPMGRSGGVLHNPHGLQRGDGTFLPTYDWTPTSLPPSQSPESGFVP